MPGSWKLLSTVVLIIWLLVINFWFYPHATDDTSCIHPSRGPIYPILILIPIGGNYQRGFSPRMYQSDKFLIKFESERKESSFIPFSVLEILFFSEEKPLPDEVLKIFYWKPFFFDCLSSIWNFTLLGISEVILVYSSYGSAEKLSPPILSSWLFKFYSKLFFSLDVKGDNLNPYPRDNNLAPQYL